MTTEQQLNDVLNKLNAIMEHFQIGAEQETTLHHINRVMCYVSRSGNLTWKAFDDDGNIIYLRQRHKILLEDAGLWADLNTMGEGETVDADITLHTIPDGDFKRPVSFNQGGKLEITPQKSPQDAVKELGVDVTNNLREIIASGNFIVLDTETTDLDGFPVQIGVLSATGETLMDTLVYAPVRISDKATAVHGITSEMVEDAPLFPYVAKDLEAHILSAKYVLGWNVDFDKKILLRAAEHYGMNDLIKAMNKAVWRDAMTPFSPIYGEWNHFHQNYKWQKLTTAAAYYDISTEGAHGAIDDCRMTLEVIRNMIEVK